MQHQEKRSISSSFPLSGLVNDNGAARCNGSQTENRIVEADPTGRSRSVRRSVHGAVSLSRARDWSHAEASGFWADARAFLRQARISRDAGDVVGMQIAVTAALQARASALKASAFVALCVKRANRSLDR